MRNITRLSISGEYYEEFVPCLKELKVSLPKTCIHLFEAYSWIADIKRSNRIKHEDWIKFWFKHKKCQPNPHVSKKFRATMNLPKFQAGKLIEQKSISRPFTSKSR
ncbi:hypothetical protein CFOL_v3_29267 [Cephalotus follicularis]|uniref:Uncharacterized protein n=1 Tax=Cephalotus follicularis TaxID=3775 RepID=A0A1Q3D0L3_CEPFO|nr:hypothetical protein CFOL_v3_29267 [Cephalotus follicularis]